MRQIRERWMGQNFGTFVSNLRTRSLKLTLAQGDGEALETSEIRHRRE